DTNGKRGAHRAKQTEHRGAKQQGNQQYRQAAPGQTEDQRQQRGEQNQSQTAETPVWSPHGQHQKRQELRRYDPLFQRTVLEIAAEKPVQREQHGQQRRHPDQPRGKGLQQLRLRPHRQREQGDDNGEENQRVGQVGRTAGEQAHFARKQLSENVAHA